jgi:hypothetical protein
MDQSKEHREVIRYQLPDCSICNLAAHSDNLFLESPLVEPTSVYTDISEFIFSGNEIGVF